MSTVRGRALRVAGKITTKNERKNNRNTVASKAFNAEITGVNHFFRQKNPEADMTNRIINDQNLRARFGEGLRFINENFKNIFAESQDPAVTCAPNAQIFILVMKLKTTWVRT